MEKMKKYRKRPALDMKVQSRISEFGQPDFEAKYFWAMPINPLVPRVQKLKIRKLYFYFTFKITLLLLA